MRKTLALFLAVFIIMLSLYVCVFASVNSEKENVIISENYIYGDRKYAEKADINFKVRYYSHLLWDINYDIAENKAETKFELHREGMPYIYEPTNYLNLSGDFWNFSTSGGSDGVTRYFSYFEKAFKELTKNAPPYEEVKKVISVSDYLDYYTMSLDINFSDKYHLDTTLGYHDTGEELLLKQMHDFFRIPVLKNHLLTISATVNESGNIFQSGSSSIASSEENSIYDEFGIYGQSVITDDKCLIYFSNKTYKGESVDTSEIPGGYGIYCLPYSYSESGDKVIFDGDNLSNVFPVDDRHEITQLKLSNNGKQIYMLTDEKNDCYLTVLDVETYDVMQKIKVSTFENQSAGINYVKDDFTIINLYHEYLDSFFTLYTIDEKGMFTKKFTAPNYLEIKNEGSEDSRYIGTEIYDQTEIDAEWDGENLYVSNGFNETNVASVNRRAGFSLGVYNKDGLQFYGNYDTSLSTGFDGMYGSTYYAMLSRYDIIDISLK